MKNKPLLLISAALLFVVLLTACSNPFFPPLKKKVLADPQVPVITVQPRDRNYPPSEEFGFAAEELTVVAVAGNGTLSYQWYTFTESEGIGGAMPIPGATGSKFTPSTDERGTFFYFVEITNSLNGQTAKVRSKVVKINIGVPQIPNIEQQPAGRNYLPHDPAEPLTVNAAVYDGGTLSYQWFRNNVESYDGGEEIIGETAVSYTPETDFEGTVYYWVKVTNTLNTLTAEVLSDIAGITVKILTAPQHVITAVKIEVDQPMKEGIPAAAADVRLDEDAHYTVSAVSWTPDHNPFHGGKVYTVFVTVVPDEGYFFPSGGLNASINDDRAKTVIIPEPEYTGFELTLSYVFAATLEKDVTGISIKTQPKLNYIHGDKLNLSALVVTLTYDNNPGDTEDVVFANFGDYFLTTQPSNNITLNLISHDALKIEVKFSAKFTEYTGPLVIGKAEAFVIESVPTQQAVGKNYITINPIYPPQGVAQDVEYAISDSPSKTAGELTWYDSTAFSPLISGKKYYIYARPKENEFYNAGQLKVSDGITTNLPDTIAAVIDEITDAGLQLNLPAGGEGNLTLYRNWDPVSITIQNSGYSIEWFFNGVPLGTGSTVVLCVNQLNPGYYNVVYDILGKHFLTVTAKSTENPGEPPSSTKIAFEVKEDHNDN